MQETHIQNQVGIFFSATSDWAKFDDITPSDLWHTWLISPPSLSDVCHDATLNKSAQEPERKPAWETVTTIVTSMQLNQRQDRK